MLKEDINQPLCANKDELVDLRDIKIDRRLSVNNRMISFIKQIKNPYLFKVGDIVVKIRFTENAPSLQDKLASIIQFYNRSL